VVDQRNFHVHGHFACWKWWLAFLAWWTMMAATAEKLEERRSREKVGVGSLPGGSAKVFRPLSAPSSTFEKVQAIRLSTSAFSNSVNKIASFGIQLHTVVRQTKLLTPDRRKEFPPFMPQLPQSSSRNFAFATCHSTPPSLHYIIPRENGLVVQTYGLIRDLHYVHILSV